MEKLTFCCCRWNVLFYISHHQLPKPNIPISDGKYSCWKFQEVNEINLVKSLLGKLSSANWLSVNWSLSELVSHLSVNWQLLGWPRLTFWMKLWWLELLSQRASLGMRMDTVSREWRCDRGPESSLCCYSCQGDCVHIWLGWNKLAELGWSELAV